MPLQRIGGRRLARRAFWARPHTAVPQPIHLPKIHPEPHTDAEHSRSLHKTDRILRGGIE